MPRSNLTPWFLGSLATLVPFLSHAAMNASNTLIFQISGTERARITAQGVSVTGIVSATTFAGDGSRLTNLPQGATTLTGNVTGSGTGTIATTIANNAVTTARIADNAVTTAKIATNAVTAAELANNSVSSSHIIDASILTADLADNAVSAAKLGANAVTTVKILDANVTTAKIADNNITTAKIATNAVTAAELANNSVSSSHIIDASILTADLADSAVTLPKIQNITTNRLLGRATTGTGNVEQLTIGSGLTLTGTTLSADTTGLPTGAIMAFDLAACPTGWSEYTPARGRFLRGIDNGAGNDPEGTRAAGAIQGDDLKSHSHSFSRVDNNATGNGGPLSIGADDPSSGYSTANTGINSSGGPETRPKNVAVLFCRKN